MSKHLTLSDRAIIEKYLAQDMPFSYIAKRLHRSPSTISREVKNHRCFVNGYRYSDNPFIIYLVGSNGRIILFNIFFEA